MFKLLIKKLKKIKAEETIDARYWIQMAILKKNYISTKKVRSCFLESETNQFLGYEIKGTKKDIIYRDQNKLGKIVKNFKY